MWNYFRQHLRWKLFLSYLIIILIGVIVLIFAAQLAISPSFNRHMNTMMGMGGGMMMDEAAGEDLFTNFQAAVWEALAWAALALFIVAAGVSSWISQRIVAPVLAMKNASSRIADGRYEERVPLFENPESGDELTSLSLSFNRMAEKLSKTEAMRSRLLGDVAHELRTPLTTIKGSMEGLIDGALPQTPETYLGISREADRLQRLVDDLQELSRVEANAVPLQLREVSVSDLVKAVSEKLRPQYEEKGVTLQVQIAAQIPILQADSDRLTQVLVNLLGNALQYTPRRGQVEISVEKLAHEITVQIRDSGVGIQAEHLPYIFDRFYRADKSRARVGGGSGIGLTISKHLVEAHGGHISVESAGLNRGSTFQFALPIP